MKTRILYLIRLFIAFLLFFALQKILFFYVNYGSSDTALSISDLWNVLTHGLGLDMSTTGYLIIFPWLIIWLTAWIKRINHKKILKPYYIIIAVILSVICVTDTSLYGFWKFKLDATIFNYIDNPKQAMASVSYGYILWRIIWGVCFSILFSWCLIRIKPQKFAPIPLNYKIVAYNIIHILIGGLIFLAIRGGVGRSTMNIGNAYYSENTFLNHAAVNPAFSLIYSWRKADNFSDKYNYLNEERRADLYAELTSDTNDSTSVCLLNNQRPNILIIVLEGFGADWVESLGGAAGVAPNIERLIKEGIFFNNVYANSFRTDRGLVSALSGHISYPTTSIMKIPAKSGKLPGIAKSLSREGYQTDFLYAGDINFTNMRSYFTSTGYQHLTSDTDFSLSERTSSSWGAHDEYGFKKLYDMIATRPANTLWHTGFLTLSSHEPFEVPFSKFDDKRANSFAYTDHCLGNFIEQVKELPCWENLLIVCIPDHGSSASFNPSTPSFYHIPMLWIGGAVKEPKVIDTLMNQSDMPSTLLAQLGIAHDEFVYSRNVLSTGYTYPYVYTTYNDGFMFKDSTGTTVYDNAAQKAVINSPTPDSIREEKGKALLQTSYDILDQM